MAIKVGSVVCLKSSPKPKMTVEAIGEDLHGETAASVVWFDGNTLMRSSLPEESLMELELE